MIPEYKLYHGAVLSELVDISDRDISIGELREEGRLSSYILDENIGLHIKHSTSRLSPWQFTISTANLTDCLELKRVFKNVYIVLVCHTDGFVTLDIEEAATLIKAGESNQAWIRAERRRGQWYSVSGNADSIAIKKPHGVLQIIDALSQKVEKRNLK